ncbi:hypothetical protein UFOVP130_61 [uncultured Caudovirales phage]|uniref:Uncharacterized protein n=1 Tax=uncultured Caudovirales phage TaxID=2100421 RepID=A0A6J5L902_9CAUD|nr:hypothetical protein UFOVP130_61 [uncultured Caudovirales phage]
MRWIFLAILAAPCCLANETDYTYILNAPPGWSYWVLTPLHHQSTSIYSFSNDKTTKAYLADHSGDEGFARFESGAIVSVKECNQAACRVTVVVSGVGGWIDRRAMSLTTESRVAIAGFYHPQ